MRQADGVKFFAGCYACCCRQHMQHNTAICGAWQMIFGTTGKKLLQMMNYAKQWEHVGGPGHWPDCDMLQIGKLSKRGPGRQ